MDEDILDEELDNIIDIYWHVLARKCLFLVFILHPITIIYHL